MPKLPRLLIIAGTLFLVLGLGSELYPASENHYEYVFPPGSIDVYDMDNNFALVKSVPFPPTQGMGNAQTRGAVASPASGMLYISYDTSGICCGNGRLVKYDLVKDQIVWNVAYASIGTDSHSISPDGQKIYMPDGESTSNGIWEIIDANTGSITGQINSGGTGPHNTNTSLNGGHVYLGPRYSNYLVVEDTATLSVIRNVGPVSGGVRPFTIDAQENYAFITTSNKVGFYVGSVTTGQILYWVCPPNYCSTGTVGGASGISHGITLSPDNTEIYLIDWPNNRVHVFDVTRLPGSAPVDVADISLKCKMSGEGWLQHSRDGRFVFVGDCGDVISTATRQVVANMPQLLNTRIFTEVDFLNGLPVFSPLSRNQGGYNTQPSNVNLSSKSLSFGPQTVNTTSGSQVTTLTNSGNSSVSIASVTITGANSGDFAETNTCGTSVAAGANCNISVTFTPTSTGTRTAVASISDSDPSSPQIVSLTGLGAAVTTTANVSPTSLTFTSQTVGSTSTAQTVTLTNTGSSTLTITGITASGDFAQTDTCGSSVAAGAKCSINVTFKPTAPGTRTGALRVTDNTSGSPQTVNLTGTGVAGTTTASLLPSSLTFSSQAVGSTSAAQTATLTNTGSSTLTITGITASGDFAETDTCGSSLQVGAKCAINVTFKPTATGTRTGTLRVTDNASGSPQTAALSASGSSSSGGDFSLSASPSSLSTTAGQSATFNLSVTPSGGFNQTVSVTCLGAPQGSVCSISPGSVTPNGSSASTAIVTVTTTARAMLIPAGRPWVTLGRFDTPTFASVALLLALALLAAFLAGKKRQARLAFGFAMIVMLIGPGCAGVVSSSDKGPGGTKGTPAGTYTLSVSGSSGSGSNVLTHSTTVTFTVN